MMAGTITERDFHRAIAKGIADMLLRRAEAREARPGDAATRAINRTIASALRLAAGDVIVDFVTPADMAADMAEKAR